MDTQENKRMEARVWALITCRHTHTRRKILNSTHTETVVRQFSRYAVTGGYAACRLVLADPSFMRLMERQTLLFSLSSQIQPADKLTQSSGDKSQMALCVFLFFGGFFSVFFLHHFLDHVKTQ